MPLELRPELEDLRDQIEPLLRPSLWLQNGPSAAVNIGGAPQLDAAASWPAGADKPMTFLAELDFEKLKARAGTDDLAIPDRGVLALFIDLASARARRAVLRGPLSSGVFAVRYATSTAPRATPADAIELPRESYDVTLHYDLPHPWDTAVVDWDWEQTVTDADGYEYELDEIYRDVAVKGGDRVRGYAYWYQPDIRGNLPGEGWTLLLQLKYRAALGLDVSEVDASHLSLWIREEDLRAAKFDDLHLAWPLP